MDWLKLLYEILGARYPRLSLVAAMFFGAAFFGGAWWLIGRAYEKSSGKTPPTVAPIVELSAEQTKKSPTASRRLPTSTPKETLPQPIREDMAAYQVPALREMIRQMGVREMWLSQVLQRGRQGGLYGIPPGGAVDYPLALRALEGKEEVQILETQRRPYHDYWGEKFTEDMRFRVKGLSSPVLPQPRPPL